MTSLPLITRLFQMLWKSSSQVEEFHLFSNAWEAEFLVHWDGIYTYCKHSYHDIYTALGTLNWEISHLPCRFSLSSDSYSLSSNLISFSNYDRCNIFSSLQSNKLIVLRGYSVILTQQNYCTHFLTSVRSTAYFQLSQFWTFSIILSCI
jgi:hypothetical protein